MVKFAAQEKLAIVPMGARTKLGIGMPPRQYDIALEMTRLDRVAAYDPGISRWAWNREFPCSA